MATRESLAIRMADAVQNMQADIGRLAEVHGISAAVIPTHSRRPEVLAVERLEAIADFVHRLAEVSAVVVEEEPAPVSKKRSNK